MLDGTLADREFPGQVVDLPPESEEVAGFYAALLESDHAKDATFNKNFFDDFLKVLKVRRHAGSSAVSCGVLT